MKHKQIVEYSKKDNAFKADTLLYLDVDNQHRQELTDLFGLLSDNNTYKVLVRRSPLLYLLSIIWFLLFLLVGLVYLRFTYETPKAITNNTISDTNRLLGVRQYNVLFRHLQTTNNQTNSTTENQTNTTVENQTESGELVDTLTDLENSVQKTLDKLKKTNITTSNQTTTNETKSTENNTKTTNITKNVPANNENNSTSPANNNTSTELKNNSTVNKTNPQNDTSSGIPINRQIPGGDSNVFALTILVFIGVIIMVTLIFEIRKRQLFKNLIEFEETNLKNFHNKMNNKIILTRCHERSSVCFMDCFSVYNFKFLVHNNGTENESININQQQNLTNQSSEIQSESAIYQAIDEEGEKYHNAVIGLNAQFSKED